MTFYLSSVRKDIDNCIKSIMDGLMRLGDDWDDRQVVSLVARKMNVARGEDEMTVVTVERRGTQTEEGEI
jgi:Holliday junction resolvase RusA-like endonuclease